MVSLTMESLDRLVMIARDAGAAAMVHYHTNVAVAQKGDKGPVTAADHAAHDLIVSALLGWEPSIPIISEEGDIPGYEIRRGWQRFWLVDPLDGTKEFIQRNGEFTVNIALIDSGEPVLGVVFAPALELMYYAGRGLGSWKSWRQSGAERIFSSSPAPDRELVVAESRSHPSPELEAYLQTIKVARRVQAGSSLKFCWVAEGKADIYPRLGPTMEWDVAAGDCVYRNSARGGQRMSSIVYNQPELRNQGFVVGLDDSASVIHGRA